MPSGDRQLFREMGMGGGCPAVGPQDLGVRVGLDIQTDANGEVFPNTGGMSVAPDDPINLHRAHRPSSLGGTGKKPVWRIVESLLGEALAYRPDPKNPARHGFVEPAAPVPLGTYEEALEATASEWAVVGA